MAELGTVEVGVRGDFKTFGKQATGALGGIGLKAAGAFAAAFAAVKVVDFFGDTITAASDLGESLNAVGKVFGDQQDVILEFGATSAESVGLAQSSFNELATVTGALLKNKGIEDFADQTLTLTERASDMASVFNTDVDDALEAINSALKGQADPIEKYGVSLLAADVNARALADTGKELTSELTDEEKALARVALIMEQTASVAGDFSETSDQLANRQRIASAQWEDAKAKIGEGLLPVMTTLMNFVSATVIPLFEKLAPVVAAVGEAIGGVVEWITQAIDGFVAGGEGVESFAGPLQEFGSWISEQLAPILQALGRLWGKLTSIWERDSDKIIATTEGLRDRIRPILEKIKVLFEKLFEAIKVIIDVATAVISFIWETWGDNILRYIRNVLNLISRVFSNVLDVIIGILDVFIGVFTGDWSRAWEGVKAIFSGIWDTIKALFSFALDQLLNLWDALPGKMLSVLAGLGSSLYNAAKDALTGFINGIRDMAGRIISAIKSYVTDKIPGFIKSVFGISSPSKLFRGYGTDMMTGLALGISGGQSEVEKAMRGLTDVTGLGIDPNVDGVGGGLRVQNVFNAPVGGSMSEFARDIAREGAVDLRFALG